MSWRSRLKVHLLIIPIAALAFPVQSPLAIADVQVSLAPRVLVVVAFGQGHNNETPTGEAKPWYSREGLRDLVLRFAEVGSVRCNPTRHVCMAITGEGKSNALAALLTLGLSSGLDLRRTYIIVSGIAGTPPTVGTLGMSAWAKWIVDEGLSHEVDSRELPKDWPFSHFRLGCSVPWCSSGWTYGTEVYHLDSATVDWAVHISHHVTLDDNPAVARYRQLYPFRQARRRPHVSSCDVVASDTYWQGRHLSSFAAWWMSKWTNGRGAYCMTAMEDAGYAEAVLRLSELGRVDRHRFLVLRTASDFDQQHPGQTARQSLAAGFITGGFEEAVENGYRVARSVVLHVDKNWSKCRKGPSHC
jgi:purine nucleoside permease